MRKQLLMLLALFIALPALAATLPPGVNYSINDDGTSITITESPEASGHIVIPSPVTIDGKEYKVTVIGQRAFADAYDRIKSIVIPDDVTTVEKHGFIHCEGLQYLEFGKGIKSLGEGALGFVKCDIMRIYAPTPPSFGIDCLYQSEFGKIEVSPQSLSAYQSSELRSHCSSFESSPEMILDPEGSVNIEDILYYLDDNGSASVCWAKRPDLSIPSKISYEGKDYIVKSIDQQAFRNQPGITSVVIPESINSIGTGTFAGCSNLESVVISPSDSMLYFGENVFEGASGLKSLYLGRDFDYEGQYTSSGPFYASNITSLEISSAVTKIPDGAFQGCTSLTSVEFPASVNKIGSYAFSDCSGITSLEIPESVQTIGEHAFRNCNGLTSIMALPVTPAGMDDNSFEGLYDKVELSVPDAKSYLATNWSLFKKLRESGSQVATFTYSDGVLNYRLIPSDDTEGRNVALVIPGDYSSLSEVTIPERFSYEADGEFTRYYVDGIGYRAFSGCKDLRSVSFNNRSNPTVIGDYSFSGCALESIVIPETVRSIGYAAFWKTGNLRNVTLNKGLESIGDFAFRESGLESIEIPGNVRTIGYGVFRYAGNLERVTLNEGLESIGEQAFRGSYNRHVESMYIPSTVKSIGADAFYNFTTESVHISDLAAWCDIDFGNAYANPLHNSKDKLYINDKKETSLIIPTKTNEIKPFAFYGFSDLVSVSLPDGLQNIGNSAFYRCFSLASVNFPKEVQSIGESAFSGCISLDSIAFSKELRSIENSAFNGCTGLASVAFPKGLQSIGNSAFNGCDSLAYVSFQEGLQSIGDKAFDGCGIEAVNIPGSVIKIGESAFSSSAKKLGFAYGPAPVAMASGAFPQPVSLAWDRPIESMTLAINELDTLTLGNSVVEIPAALFKGASKLDALTLGNALTSIGDEAFSGCTKLKEVVVPPSVETIGASAFAGNGKLSSIIMGHKVKTIGDKAFDGCPANTVSITAQTPPTAPNNTFSSYTGNLYLQGKDAVEAYYNAYTCWDRFNGLVMVEATEIKLDGDKKIDGKPGDTFQLTATLWPDNVTLPQIFWRSTNPDIASVDENGLVTLHADLDEVMAMAESDDDMARSCKIIAESLYANGPVLEVTVNDISAGIDGVIDDTTESGEIDYTLPVEVYTFGGMRVGDNIKNLAPGIYIVRQGRNVKKIAVK